ncbi:hypothetical protein ACMFMF_004896 [Clarireedia jacksonii]
MGKRQFTSQASSTRAASGAGFGGLGFATASSTLSYVTEPPNLSSISDANVVVSFKNLYKKDGTTKSRALEELRAYVQGQPHERGGTEEAILEAWVKVYPRLAIDSSRRVRELSHSVQYELLRSARKRMEKYIPKVVGSWLAGTFDKDRSTSRAAKDGLTSFLDTDTKVALFWKRCQAEILEYVEEAFNETPQTLSDERSVAAEDADEKYYRVVSACLYLLTNLLAKLSNEDISKHREKYEGVVRNNKKLWTLASCEDSSTRIGTHKLLALCLEKQADLVSGSLETISRAFISKALRATQTASALSLVQALVQLTRTFPESWTSAYKGKHSPIDDLKHFVQKGSQGASAEYWQTLRALVVILPIGVLPREHDEILKFLESFRKGINHREESKFNSSAAWSSYLETAKLCICNLSSPKQVELVQKSLYPIFGQYMYPTAQSAEWSIRSTAQASTICSFVCTIANNASWQSSLKEEWQRIAQELITRIQTSMPEQSKEYSISQNAVMSESQRWFEVLSNLLEQDTLESTQNPLIEPTSQILENSIQVITNRNGKPYSAAAILDIFLRLAPKVVESSAPLSRSIRSFMESDLPALISSPSSQYLVSAMNHFRSLSGGQKTFEAAWQASITSLLSAPQDEQTRKVVTALVSSREANGLIHTDKALQNYILQGSIEAIEGNNEAWPLFEAAVLFDGFAGATEQELVQRVLSQLDIDNPNLNYGFKAIELLSRKRPQTLRDGDIHVELITKLLALTEVSDSEIKLRAASVRSMIDSINGQDGVVNSSIVNLLKSNLESASSQSLNIDTLVQQAEALISTLEGGASHEIFPDTSQWQEALAPFLQEAPNPTLGVIRPFAGAVFLAHSQDSEQLSKASRDSVGYSVALRMAIYSARLIRNRPDSLTKDELVEVLYLISLTAELASDQLDLLERNKLFASPTDDSASTVQDFVGSLYQACFLRILPHSKAWREGMESGEPLEFSGVIHNLIFKFIKAAHGGTPTSFYAARSLSRLLPRLVEEHGWQSTDGEEWLSKLDILKASTQNVLGATAILIGLHETLTTSQLVSNLCNRIISEITGASAQAEKTLALLVLLNACLSIYDDDDLPVAQNRLVFAVKQILSWTPDVVKADYLLSSEVCRALQKLLPAIKTVYGSYWESTLTFCINIWETMESGTDQELKLPMVGMSLKLFSTINNLQDANDDLEDALAQYGEKASRCFIRLMQLPRSKSTQPAEFVDSMLSRLISKIPSSHIHDVSEFYPLLASENRTVQSAAFDVLHRAIPAAQEEISVNALIEKKDAQLPEELLSLLLDAPSINNFDDEELSEFPPSVRSYLLSWHLVYDSFSSASWKVRKDYLSHLQSENCIGSFLTFLFDVLGHSDGRPLDLDRANFDESYIRSYDLKLAEAETNERNMQWLLIHLYHLSLKHTADLVKNWFSACQSKQTRMAVEAWTEKYFTPLLISDKFDEIEEWTTSAEAKEAGEKELMIKVSKGKREVFVGYEVDETAIRIAIQFPQNYPFYNVKVEGLNRVAVPERKWRNWLLIVQGAITFSNGSLIDGLTTFRRNVEGSLKGHTECAICYSIISSEKKIPDKRCGTLVTRVRARCADAVSIMEVRVK